MRGARIGNRTDPPLPVLMALIISSGSTPAFKRERHRFADRRRVDRHQQIVDELDLAGGAERAEIETELAEVLMIGSSFWHAPASPAR